MCESIIERTCRICENTKGLSLFTKDKLGKLGYSNRCKSCAAEIALKHSRTDHGRKVQAAYRKSDRGKATKRKHKQSPKGKTSDRRYREKNSLAIKARGTLNNAITAGKVVRPDTCSAANENCSGKIEGHHHDFSKPFDVTWVCTYHHNLVEKKR